MSGLVAFTTRTAADFPFGWVLNVLKSGVAPRDVPQQADERILGESRARASESPRHLTCPSIDPFARDKRPMPNFTEPELRQRYCEAMGSDLGEVFHQLMQEAAWLHLKWNEYIALFANATRVNQLNRAAPGFFRMVEETWSDDLILHICRMTDKGNDVLTVRLIPKLVTVALRDEVNSRLRRLTAAVDFAQTGGTAASLIATLHSPLTNRPNRFQWLIKRHSPEP